MLELTGLAIGAVVYRRARIRPALLRAAILAQLVDLVSFSFVWGNNFQELNPLVNFFLGVAMPLEGLLGYGLVLWVSFLMVAGLKLGLIVYLDRVSPHLGRYRRVVLLAALGVGAVGALSNLAALPILQ
jgi:hypothetical protein